MIADLARTQRDLLKLDDAIDFIFDDQIDKKDRLIAAWDSFKKMGHPTFKHLMGDTPAFRDDKNVLPLQAADLHAWLVRKRWDDYATGQPETRIRGLNNAKFQASPLSGEKSNYEPCIPCFLKRKSLIGRCLN
jgi:hypothetical protein